MKSLSLIVLLLVYLSSSLYAIRGETLSDKHLQEKLQKGVVSIEAYDQKEWKHGCTGSVVNSSTILTAAHCFDHKNFQIRIKYLGNYYKADTIKINKKYQSKNIYDPVWENDVIDIKLKNDFAIIKLIDEIKDNVKITEEIFVPNNTSKMLISGYGQDDMFFAEGTDGIYRVSEYTFLTEVSENKYKIDDDYSGACVGDSGGPLWYLNKQNEWIIIGVISQGDCDTFTYFEPISLNKLKNSQYNNFSVKIKE